MTAPLASSLVTTLTGGQMPRVWSLLVTIFGEMALADDAVMSGQALSDITLAIGIKPEAQRVALHRLRKDGWLQSEKQGRTSHYRLTDWGRAQSKAASPRIYGNGPLASQAWLSVYERSAAPEDGVGIAPNIRLTAMRPHDKTAFVTEVTPEARFPDWMREKVCSDDHVAQMQRFATDLQTCANLLDQHADLSPQTTTLLRVLLVHEWRRRVLKLPDLPDHVFPKSWPGPSCRAHVTNLLAAYPRT